MPESDLILTMLGVVVVAAPLLLTIVLGGSLLLGIGLAESRVASILGAGMIAGLVGSIAILAWMLATGLRHVAIEIGDWVVLPNVFRFSVKFVFDRLSVPFVILSYVLIGTIGAFASRYLHRESGYNRFFMSFTLFALGMVTTSLAGTIETLFAGWELVGLSSALLVAYYQERPAPARNGLWLWSIYRISDAALLLASVVMRHLHGKGDFTAMLGAGIWPAQHAVFERGPMIAVGLLLIFAAAGKSALIPFSGWLPRAMEGPTPSSAIFYGALSVHLGVFLLLRVSPLIEQSAFLCGLLVALGLATALLAYAMSSVQTDIKSSLSYASLAQVGIIVVEIGLGFRYLALVHILGHACLRTLQFLRAPSLLHDYHTLENAIGGHLPSAQLPWLWIVAKRGHSWLYRLALERGYLDPCISRLVVAPFVRVFRSFDALERRWTDLIAGRPTHEPDAVRSQFGTIDEYS
jgi:NAD(P)H-quinone oxidoreductase subunit 5